jgi:hypothetical protein
LDGDRFGLFVAEGDDGVGGFAIDELDAEDLGVGEGGGDEDIEVGALCWSFDFLVRELDSGQWGVLMGERGCAQCLLGREQLYFEARIGAGQDRGNGPW